MIVALVRDGHAVFDPVDRADAKDAGVFADRYQHIRRARRQRAQQRAAALVRAMLAPLDRERVCFGTRRVAADARGDRAQFRGRERERLATCEALEVIIGSGKRQRLGGERDRIERDRQLADAFPLVVTGPPVWFRRASDSITVVRLRYCDTSTRPYNTVSSAARIFAAASAAFSGSSTTMLAMPDGRLKLERTSIPEKFEPIGGHAMTALAVAASTNAESALLRPAMVT